MKAAVPLLALLLAGLNPAVNATATTTTAAAAAAAAATTTAKPMADESSADAAAQAAQAAPAPAAETPAAAAAAAAEPDPLSKQKRRPIHLRGHDGNTGRGPVVTGPATGTGGTKDVTNSQDAELLEVTTFADDYMTTEHPGVTFVLVKAVVQVVAGLKYTLHYEGVNEKRVVVVFAQPWLNKMEVQHDDTECPNDTESHGS